MRDLFHTIWLNLFSVVIGALTGYFWLGYQSGKQPTDVQVNMGGKGPYEQFVLFGDSLTQQSHSQDLGFASAAALQNAFIRRLDVINRGFSGYTSEQGLIVLPEFMPNPSQAKIRFLYIFFGANDACLEPAPQHVPLDRYTSNLEKIIKHPTVQAHDAHIFLINPPPINQHELERTQPNLERTAENTKKYADACRELGSRLSIPVVDIWTALAKKAGWEEGDELPGSKKIAENPYLKASLRDGLHFNPAGYMVLYEEIMALIQREWPDEAAASDHFVLPAWTDAPGLL